MATLIVYSDAASGMAYCISATSRTNLDAGTGTLSSSDTSATIDAGTYGTGTAWNNFEGFFQFDTSPLGDSDTVTAASLNIVGAVLPSTAFTLYVYDYDWGGSVTSADYRTKSQLAAMTARGSVVTSSLSTSAYTAISLSSPASYVSRTGMTRLMTANEKYVDGLTVPTTGAAGDLQIAMEETAGSASDPYLSVTYTSAGTDYSVASSLTGAGAVATSGTGTLRRPQTAVTFTPAVDGTVQSTSSGSNDFTSYGNGTSLATNTASATMNVGDWYTATSFYSGFIGLWSFDTSSLPDTAQVTSATLSLKNNGASTVAQTTNFDFRWFDFGSTIDTTDWRTPTQYAALTAASAATASTNFTSGSYYAVALTNVSNVSLTGFTRIAGTTSRHATSTAPTVQGGNYLTFHSVEATTSTNRPVLTVNYTDVVAATTDYAVAADLTGAGAVTGTTTAALIAAASVTGAGSLGANIIGDTPVSASITGAGSTTAAAGLGTSVAADLTGAGATTNTGFNTAVAADLSGVGALTAHTVLRHTVVLTASTDDGQVLGQYLSASTYQAGNTPNSFTPNTTNTQLLVEADGASSTPAVYESFLHFDTSALPATATIISATLKLTSNQDNRGVTACNTLVYPKTWTAPLSSAAWVNRTSLPTSVGTITATSGGELPGVDHTVSLTATAVNLGGTTGLMLVPDTYVNSTLSTKFQTWASSDNGTSARWPTLTVVYDTGDGADYSVAAPVTGVGALAVPAVLGAKATSALVGAGAMSAAILMDAFAAAALSGVGALTADAHLVIAYAVAAALAGAGTLGADAHFDRAVAAALAGLGRLNTLTSATNWGLSSTSAILGSAGNGWDLAATGTYGAHYTTTRAVFGEAGATHTASIASPSLTTGWRGLLCTTSLGSSSYTYTKDGVSQGTFDPTLDYNDLTPGVYRLSVDFGTSNGSVDGLRWERSPIVSLQGIALADLVGAGALAPLAGLVYQVLADLTGAGSPSVAAGRGQPVASALSGAGALAAAADRGLAVLSALIGSGSVTTGSPQLDAVVTTALLGVGALGADLHTTTAWSVAAALVGLGVTAATVKRRQPINAALRGEAALRELAQEYVQRAGMKPYGWTIEDGTTWFARWLRARGVQ